MTRKLTVVSAEDFVAAWQKADSLAAVSKALGEPNTVRLSARAASFRQRGIQLKKFTGGAGLRLDYHKLAAMAKKLK